MTDNTESKKYSSIHQENLQELVHAFYPKVLKDEVLAPFFIKKLGEDIKTPPWKEHLKLLTEFWKFVALGFDDYKGNPLQPHFYIEGISREAFKAWLYLFHQTADELFDETASSYLKNKSNEIAENFIHKLEL